MEPYMEQDRLLDAGAFPKVVLIDTVSFCDLRCSMCVHREMTRKKGVMKWDTFTKIIDEVAKEDKTARVWLVFFGEALILKRREPTIFKMVHYAKSKGLTDVVLNSNANLLDDAAARAIITSGLDAIYIGIDAFSEETYAKLRVGGNYSRVVSNVRNLIAHKRELNSKTPQVFVQFVEMDSNRKEMSAFIKFWTSEGASVKIRPKVSWAGSINAPDLVLGNEDRWPCYWAMRTMSITDQGEVVICAVDLDAKCVVGNVKNRSLKEIWGAKLAEFRKYHLHKQWHRLPPICSNCKDWQSAKATYYQDLECV